MNFCKAGALKNKILMISRVTLTGCRLWFDIAHLWTPDRPNLDVFQNKHRFGFP